MNLSPKQINELLSIIEHNQVICIGKELGIDFLTEENKTLLEENKVDWKTLYNPSEDSIYTGFHFGMLSQSLKDTKALNKLSYKQLKQYIQEGNYIPITEREQLILDHIRQQTFSDIRSLNGRIFQDVNNILIDSSRKTQTEFLKREIEEGMRKKLSLREISNELSRKTGDWKRDFDRIVEYQSNTAYQEGRASFLLKTEGSEVEVYKRVFQSGCDHCIRLYLKGGYGSEPKVFRLTELRANGDNIGRKVDEWKPIVGSTHPFCRCNLHHKQQGYKWNPQTQSFDIFDDSIPILKKPREKIKISIGGVETMV